MSTYRGMTRWMTVLAGALLATMSWADDYAQDWGPAAGTRLPVLEAPDQTGTMRTLGDLSGERGLLLLLSRSADW